MLSFNYITNDFWMLTVSLFCAVCCKFSFMYIICSEAGQPLRDELSKSPQKILSSAFSEFLPKSEVALASSGEESHVSSSTDAPNNLVPTSSATSDAYFQGLALIKTLVKLMPGWLQSNRTVFDTLVLLWKSPARISRLQNEQELNLVQVSIGNPQFS
jgi:transformation/transcription domain-associated protein